MARLGTETDKPSPVYWFARLVDSIEKKDFTLANVATEKLDEAGYRVKAKDSLIISSRPSNRREAAK